MLCRHCGRKISLLRRLTDTEFCSDRHRADFLELEREAALARLAESGARIIPREPPPTRKGSQKQPKAKDEIPAPLAGILREPCLIPKTKRKILTHTRMMGWTLIQELPQLTLTVQARRMDLAGGMPMEFHPARLSPLVQNGLSEPAEQPGGVEETDVPPVAGLAMIDGLAPVLDQVSWRVGLAAWLCGKIPLASLPRLVGLHPAVEARWPGLVAAVDLTPPNPVRSRTQPHAAGSAWNPEACGLTRNRYVTIPSSGGETHESAHSEVSQGRREEAVDPLPGGALAGLAPVELFMCRAPRPWLVSQPRSLGPRRRLVGPRVPPAIARQLQLGLGAATAFISQRPLKESILPQSPSVSPLDWGIRQPGLESLRFQPVLRDGALDLQMASLCLLSFGPAAPGLRPSRCSEVNWNRPEVDALPPSLGFELQGDLMPPAGPQPTELACSVQEPDSHPLPIATASANPASAEPVVSVLRIASMQNMEAEQPPAGPIENAPSAPPEYGFSGPAMLDRQFPLYVCRGLRSQATASVQAVAAPSWQEQLGRAPLIRPLRLIPDHADGSGSRISEIKLAEPSKPWLSIHLPSLPVASWRAAPADLKWITLALPAILLLALYSFLPARSKNSVETATTGNGQPSALSQRFETIRTAIMERAAVKLADDFRAGLGAWQGNSGWAQTWTYTDASFVSPGQLALYRPSLGMKDYVFAFLGQIDRRSLNWVVRARDENNYVAMRIVMTRSGPMPSASLVRYAVLNGKMDRQTTLPLPVAFKDGTMQQVEVTVAGDTITTRIMGQVVDSFTEDRLADGGVGFYSPKGDRSLLRWVSITHQYDYIGRLCALLAPYNVSHEARRKG